MKLGLFSSKCQEGGVTNNKQWKIMQLLTNCAEFKFPNFKRKIFTVICHEEIIIHIKLINLLISVQVFLEVQCKSTIIFIITSNVVSVNTCIHFYFYFK